MVHPSGNFHSTHVNAEPIPRRPSQESFSSGEEDGIPAARTTSSSAGSNSPIQEAVRQFERQRKEERRAKMARVVRIAMFCSGPGIVLFTVGYLVRNQRGVLLSAVGCFIVLSGYILFGVGVAAITTSPLDDFDFDILVERKPAASRWFAGCISVLGVYTVVTAKGVFKYVWVPRLLFALLAFVGAIQPKKMPRWWFLQSTTYALWAVFTAGGVVAAPIELNRRDNCEEHPIHRIGSYIVGPLLSLYIIFYCRRFWKRAQACWPVAKPTIELWYATYVTYLALGAQYIITSCLMFAIPPACMEELEFFLWTVELIPRGVFYFFTPLIILYLGRHRAFDIIARPAVITSFEQARQKRDGTFLAELLDSVMIQVGSTWWVHHGENKDTFGQFDPRRNWDKGEVIKIKDGHFDVKLETRIVRLPMASRGMSSEDMMQYAKSTLRCIDWLEIVAHKQDLFFSDAADGQAGTLTQLTGGNLFHCSRPVKPGEQIDFFMSHSWHDDRRVKWKQLETFAKNFYTARGRYPTLWLDNVCIDQCKIGEGLRVLPINLMSCQKLLIVTGRTYPTRLWCAWEMITLFAFSDLAHAVDRVEVLPINDGSNFDALVELERFEVSKARCYDPNEEFRLREVIAAVGEDRFNSRVRTLAAAVRARPAKATP